MMNDVAQFFHFFCCYCCCSSIDGGNIWSDFIKILLIRMSIDMKRFRTFIFMWQSLCAVNTVLLFASATASVVTEHFPIHNVICIDEHIVALYEPFIRFDFFFLFHFRIFIEAKHFFPAFIAWYCRIFDGSTLKWYEDWFVYGLNCAVILISLNDSSFKRTLLICIHIFYPMKEKTK